MAKRKIRQSKPTIAHAEFTDAGPGEQNLSIFFTPEQLAQWEERAASIGMDVMELFHNSLQPENLQIFIDKLKKEVEQDQLGKK
jgi:hypothetical protein